MIGAAVSDLHLGFRAFAATLNGRNAREVDVERAWFMAVDRIVRARPRLVTVAGDIFHHVKPGNHAIRAWQRGIARIVQSTDAHVVAIPGNHDGARSADTLPPALLVPDEPRVHVVLEPKRLRLAIDGRRVSIACLPFVALAGEQAYALEPDPDADLNVLLIHAAVRTSAVDGLPKFYAGDTALDIGREAEHWDVIAAGDFHEFRRLHPTRLAFYSGSVERASSNIWDERGAKGVVLYDTDAGSLELLEVPGRPVCDYTLDDILGRGTLPTAENANAALARILAGPDHTGAIVRLVVSELPRAQRDAIDWALVRRLKSCCLHFQLELHCSDGESVSIGEHRAHARTLLETARTFLADEPEDVRDLAIEYLMTVEVEAA